MKKMNKRISAAIALSLSAVLLAGCGKNVEGVNQSKLIEKYAKNCTLGDYKTLSYTETKTTVTDDDVEDSIDELMDKYSTDEKITEGTVDEGDSVNIDFVGKVDGKEFEGGSTNGAGYTLDHLGNSGMIPGFEEQIMGHKIGETFDINVTFPDEYPNNTDLEGKPAVFTITINYRTDTYLPTIDDAFIASNTDYKSLDEYRTAEKERLTKEAQEDDQYSNRQSVLESAMKVATINSYPEEELKRLIDSTMENVENQAENSGYDLASFVMAYGYEDIDSFRESIKEDVQEHISEKILVCAVAKAEGITVDKSEFEIQKKKMMDQTGYSTEDELYKVYPQEDVLYYALADKVADYLLSIATPTVATDSDAE